jgi:hypothetical protein
MTTSSSTALRKHIAEGDQAVVQKEHPANGVEWDGSLLTNILIQEAKAGGALLLRMKIEYMPHDGD